MARTRRQSRQGRARGLMRGQDRGPENTERTEFKKKEELNRNRGGERGDS